MTAFIHSRSAVRRRSVVGDLMPTQKPLRCFSSVNSTWYKTNRRAERSFSNSDKRAMLGCRRLRRRRSKRHSDLAASAAMVDQSFNGGCHRYASAIARINPFRAIIPVMARTMSRFTTIDRRMVILRSENDSIIHSRRNKRRPSRAAITTVTDV